MPTLNCGHTDEKYGKAPNGTTHCYPCCADLDREWMRSEGRIALYLTKTDGKWTVTNWPGSLEFKPIRVKLGCHNIAQSRMDAWFVFEGRIWHGVNLGDNQILRCLRTKQPATT